MISTELHRNQVDLWVLPLSTVSARSFSTMERATLLSDTEKNRYDHFKIDSKKEEFLSSRLLLRFLLTRYSKMGAEGVEAIPDTMGRPFWMRGRERIPLYFSLSHTRGMICCAIADCAETGCDVEQDRPRKYEKELSRKVFSEQEADCYHHLAEGKQREFFYRSWTLKEAFVKAMGKGLRIPLTSLSFTHTVPLDTRTSVESSDLNLAPGENNWTFLSVKIHTNYIFSCATSKQNPEITLYQPNFEGMICRSFKTLAQKPEKQVGQP
jgi:4'-phosphopantetheinyl transferase